VFRLRAAVDSAGTCWWLLREPAKSCPFSPKARLRSGAGGGQALQSSLVPVLCHAGAADAEPALCQGSLSVRHPGQLPASPGCSSAGARALVELLTGFQAVNRFMLYFVVCLNAMLLFREA